MKIFPILLFTVCFFSCKNMGPKKFDLEGHRGCRGLMPENTIPAMLKAIDLGVNTLELDVVITADNKVVVSHEPFFNHEITTLPSGNTFEEKDQKQYNIYRMTYDSVLTYDVGIKPNLRFPSQQKIPAQKPLLSTLIDSVEACLSRTSHHKVFYNIEIKSKKTTDNIFHPEPEKFADLLLDIIYQKGIQSRVIIQSFDPRSLKIVSEKYPSMRISLLIEDQLIPTGHFFHLYGFKPDIVSPDYVLLSKAIVDSHRQSKLAGVML